MTNQVITLTATRLPSCGECGAPEMGTVLIVEPDDITGLHGIESGGCFVLLRGGQTVRVEQDPSEIFKRVAAFYE